MSGNGYERTFVKLKHYRRAVLAAGDGGFVSGLRGATFGP